MRATRGSSRIQLRNVAAPSEQLVHEHLFLSLSFWRPSGVSDTISDSQARAAAQAEAEAEAISRQAAHDALMAERLRRSGRRVVDDGNRTSPALTNSVMMEAVHLEMALSPQRCPSPPPPMLNEPTTAEVDAPRSRVTFNLPDSLEHAKGDSHRPLGPDDDEESDPRKVVTRVLRRLNDKRVEPAIFLTPAQQLRADCMSPGSSREQLALEALEAAEEGNQKMQTWTPPKFTPLPPERTPAETKELCRQLQSQRRSEGQHQGFHHLNEEEEALSEPMDEDDEDEDED